VDDPATLLAEADARDMSGWDFGWLGSRMTSSGLPWDYPAIVGGWVSRSTSVLDMGTGGGEFLARVHGLPPRTVATEGWAPNVRVAAQRLSAVHISVVHDEGATDNLEQRDRDARGRLSFRDESFDLVHSRHEAYNPGEVRRVLRSDGAFLTQQAGSGGTDAGALLGVPRPHESFDRAFAVEQLREAGFVVVDGDSAVEAMTFADIGAFAWYLNVIPWIVPGFTIEGYRPRLLELHERGTPLVIRATRFWLLARKGAMKGTS
jgi:SAM-dependent methyltransferase